MNAEFSQAKIFSSLNGLSEVKLAAKNESPEALKEVATQFESLFMQMMLKTMREANQSEGLFDSNQMQFYEEMYDKQLSMHLAERKSIGIADMLLRQLGGSSTDEENKQLKPLPNPNPAIAVFARAAAKAREVISDKNPDVESVTRPGGNSKPDFPNPETFIKELKPIAEKYAKQLGVDADVLIAQAALETGWGKKIINSGDDSSHNLFGIKDSAGWQGEKVNVKTLEYRDDQMKQEVASFRSYGSFEQSFQDYVSFIKNNSRYQDALNKTEDATHYVEALQTAGYATDPKYAEKIMNILNRGYFNRG